MNAFNAAGLIAIGFFLGMACCLLFADGIQRTLQRPDRAGEDAAGIRADTNTLKVSK